MCVRVCCTVQAIVSTVVSTCDDVKRFIRCTMLEALVVQGAKAATHAALDWLKEHLFIR